MCIPRGEIINAVYAVVKYPQDILTPVSINHASSSFVFFIEETSNKEEGIVTLAYVTIYPIENDAIVGDISFKTVADLSEKENKIEQLSFLSDSMVLAHDGNGTDVLGTTTPIEIK